MLFISVRKHVISSHWPNNILFLNGIKKFSRRRILKLNISIAFIEMIDQLIKIFILLESKSEKEVSSDWNQKLVRFIDLLHLLHMIVHRLDSFVNIISLEISIINNRISIISTVVWLPTEFIWREVLFKHRMSEDLGVVASVLRKWFPNPFHGLV